MAADRSLARVAVVAVALLLLWRIIQVNLVLHEATGQPRVVPLPGVAAALRGDRSEDTTASLGGMLDDNPGEVAALLMLAQERERTGDTAGASRAYRVALGLAPVDREALALASAHLLRQDDPAAVELLDRLVTAHPGTRSRAFPVLASLLSRSRFQPALGELALRNPAWLDPFLADACARGTDPELLAPLVLRANAAGAADTAASACVIDRLRRAGRWEQAYHLWLNLLPKERRGRLGFVFNGGFEFPPAGRGFDWITQTAPEKSAGHVAEVVRAQGAQGQRALRIAYNANRQSGVPARQYLALQPGRYELTGLVRLEGIKATRGIAWTVRCVVRGAPGEVVARSERFVGTESWRRFSMEVTIDAACSGQVLQLEPVLEGATVAFVTGTAWFDDFGLRRR